MSGQVPTEWGWMDERGEVLPWTEQDEEQARHALLKGMVSAAVIYVVASGLFFSTWAVIKMIGGM